MAAHRSLLNSIGAARIAGAYIGTVVGAGFASGQETLRFFGIYGGKGLWGLALSTILFIVYGTLVLQLGCYLHARSHLDVVREIAGPRLGSAIDAFITVSLLAALTVMAAGTGAAMAAQFGWPEALGSVMMLMLTVVTVLLGINGVVTVISAVAPFLIGGTILLSLLVMCRFTVNLHWVAPDANAGFGWPLAAVAYVSYNLILSIAVLAPMGALSNPRELRRGAFWGGIGLGLSAAAVDLAILTQVPEVATVEIPMLFIVAKVLAWAPLAYTLLLLAEIYTTAVAGLYGFVVRLVAPGSNWFPYVTVAAAVSAFVGSQIGFSRLVGGLYSLMGYMGLLVLFALTLWWIRHTRANAVNGK